MRTKVSKTTLLWVYILTAVPDQRPRRTFKEWITAFIENDAEEFYGELYDQQAAEDEDFPGSRPLESDSRHEDGYYDDLDFDIDEGMLEGLLIVALAAVLMVLVYMRQQQQRRNQAQNQNNNNANANQNDRGVFPRPEDPDFRQWVAGGVGH